MSAATLGIIALCALAGTYLYVTGLCYLCDLHEQKKLNKREEQEKRRKEELHRAIEETERRRKEELARRKQLAETRRQRVHAKGRAPRMAATSHRAAPDSA